jgi:hypothetical protein
MKIDKQHPRYIHSLLRLKCARCRQGDMYIHKKSYSKKFREMHEKCPMCRQPMEIEPSFYYGTGYVSYALAVLVTIASFIVWWLILGLSVHDNRFFWWIGLNAVLLLVLLPNLMRLSRTVWLSFLPGMIRMLLPVK